MSFSKEHHVIKTNPTTEDSRLLIVSSESENCRILRNIIRKNIRTITYKYDISSLDDVLASVIAELGGKKVDSIAFILHGAEKELYITGIGKMIVSYESLLYDDQIKEFFMCLSSTFMNNMYPGARMDFLGSAITDDEDKTRMEQLLMKMTHCQVNISGDLYGPTLNSFDSPRDEKSRCVGDLYFLVEVLEELLRSSVKSEIKNLAGYELVRTVGKGAFGTAVLYHKKDDDSFVIIKQINMHDLTASERQLAINEVSVLSMLNHENIVSYYDSFEEDGVLMIEMEYADGGTLAQYLTQIKSPIEEPEILLMFKQIVSAIKHMHDHSILHRDLKTANIFLTKEGIVKVGDFGISKMLTTRQGGALTVVGTPYYISPEMCEGKLYNQKSDIWALGCILYEMACQQKTFEGSNLPALVNKIVKGQFAPVKGNYSPAFRQLVRDLLQRDPDFRPTATEILDVRLPTLLKTYDIHPKEYDDSEISMEFDSRIKSTAVKSSLKQPLRSVLYDIKMYQSDISLTPIHLPPRSKIKDVAVSSTHMIVVTSELMVFTWGDGRKGQLGHGKLETWREKPLYVEALKGKNITRVCAGEGFSVFSSDNGIVMTCGNGSQGCLGHGDWNMCIKPKLIEKLLSVDVSAVSCGRQHVVVIGGEGEAYSWGCGAGGRLGTGSENDCYTPTEVKFLNDIRVIRAYCGHDGTMFITETGSLLACGQNDYNKLGLNEQKGFLSQMKQFISKTEIEKQVVPLKLGWLRQHVVSVSMGANHTAVLVEPGKVITFGCNKNGQLGRGHQRSHLAPSTVKALDDRTITMVQCGDTFTVAGTAENSVYFWGSRQVLSANGRMRNATRPLKKTDKKKKQDIERISEISEASVSEVIKIGETNSPLMREIERIGPDSPIIQIKTPPSTSSDSPISQQRFLTGSSTADEMRDSFVDSCTGRKDTVLNPQEILALYASSAQVAKGEIVKLMNLFCFGMQVYLVVDTTAPLPRSLNKKPKQTAESEPNKAVKKSSALPIKNNSPAEDSLGPIPKWLPMEMENAATVKGTAVKASTNQIIRHDHDVLPFSLPSPASEKNEIPNGNGNSSKHHLDKRENTLRIELQKVIQEKKVTEEKLKKLEERLSEKEDQVSVIPNIHERELEIEIAELREQLQQRFGHSRDYGVYRGEPPKQEVWSKKKSTKSKFRSRICNVQ